MLADDAGSLDPFVEAAEQLIEALTVSELNSHALTITPPRGDLVGRKSPTWFNVPIRGQPYPIAGIAPATHRTGYRADGLLTSDRAACQNVAFSLVTPAHPKEFP
jgi:hypothetical protein